jgi:hypothetical protein
VDRWWQGQDGKSSNQLNEYFAASLWLEPGALSHELVAKIAIAIAFLFVDLRRPHTASRCFAL